MKSGSISMSLPRVPPEPPWACPYSSSAVEPADARNSRLNQRCTNSNSVSVPTTSLMISL